MSSSYACRGSPSRHADFPALAFRSPSPAAMDSRAKARTRAGTVIRSSISSRDHRRQRSFYREWCASSRTIARRPDLQPDFHRSARWRTRLIDRHASSVGPEPSISDARRDERPLWAVDGYVSRSVLARSLQSPRKRPCRANRPGGTHPSTQDRWLSAISAIRGRPSIATHSAAHPRATMPDHRLVTGSPVVARRSMRPAARAVPDVDLMRFDIAARRAARGSSASSSSIASVSSSSRKP